MMLKSVEAEIGADGRVRLREPLPLSCRHRAVVTVLERLDSAEDSAQTAADETCDWRRFAGVMRDSPHFNADPVAIQKAIRDEWD
ncbi:MAG: hypothetical protein HQL07_14005 [Nitrospirae bacterium]|nr:hypothetical protein [Magnetococcales bacterium]HAT50255.1 hypothetical protein [Alphaproteobacteria bacterium]